MPKTSIQLNINTVGELNFKGLTRRMAAFSKEAEDGCAQMKILHTRYKALVEAQKEFDSNAGGNNDSEMGDDYEELQEKLADCRKELRELQTELLAATVTPPFSKAHTVQPLYGRGGETMTDMLSNSSGAASLMALFSTSTSAIGIAAAAAAAVTGFQGSTEERDAKFAMVVTKEFARVTGNSNQDLAQSVGAGIAEAMAGDEDIDMGSVVERYLSLTSEMGQKTRQWDKGIGLEYMEGRIPGLESEKAFDKSHGDQLATAKGASAELMGEFESERNRAKQKAYKALFDENENYSQMLKTATDPTTPDKERWTAQAAIARMLKEADATAEQTFKSSEIYRTVNDSEMLLIDNIQRKYRKGNQMTEQYGIEENLGEGMYADQKKLGLLSSVLAFSTVSGLNPLTSTDDSQKTFGTPFDVFGYKAPSFFGGSTPPPSAPGAYPHLEGGITLPYSDPFNPNFGQKAFGQILDPFDNFPALLHQGERVLTASEARAADGGGSVPPITITGNTFTVREEADIDKIALALAQQLAKARLCYAP